MKLRPAALLGLCAVLAACAAPRPHRAEPTPRASVVTPPASSTTPSRRSGPTLVLDGPGLFPFEGIDVVKRRGGALDVSSSLDAPAGKHGRLRAKGERWVFEDGAAFSPWGVGLEGSANFPNANQAAYMAEYAAQFGWNLVKHSFRFPDEGTLERFDHLVAELTARGLYQGLEFEFDGTLDDITQVEERMSRVLLHQSPHSDRTYAADPALALVLVTRTGAPLSSDPRQALDREAALRERLKRYIRATGYAGLVGLSSSRLDAVTQAYLSTFDDVGTAELSALPSVISLLETPEGPLLEAVNRRAAGRPYLLRQRAVPVAMEGAFQLTMLTAYSRLQGFGLLSAPLSNAAFERDEPGCSPGHFEELRCLPNALAVMPALSRLAQRKDVVEAPASSPERVAPSALFDSGVGISPLLPFVTRTGLEFQGNPSAAPGGSLLGFSTQQAATSVTGQLFIEFGRSRLTIDTPRSQGVVGRGDGTRVAASNLSVRLGSGSAVVLATALDSHALAKASRVLVSVSARTTYRGMTLALGSRNVLDPGELPLLLEPVVGTLELGGLSGDVASASVWIVDASGSRVRGVAFEIAPGTIRFELRAEHRTSHYEVVR